MAFNLEGFIIIMGRLSGLFISAPIFASRQLPARIKILIIILLSALLARFVPVNQTGVLETPAYFVAALVLEVLIGFSMGFVAYVVFAAIQLAGQLMDMQMGFGVVNVLDPQSGIQVPLMGNFCYLFALLVYLALNGHHYLLQAVTQSYQIIPVMGANLGGNLLGLMTHLTAYLFLVAVKISAPVVVAILITDISMGFIARTVPQMNVLMVGLPIKIFVGYLTLWLLMPVYIWFMGVMFSKFVEYLDQVLICMGI